MIELLSTQLPQIIGFIALILGVTGYQFNRRYTILAFQGSANLLWTIHFYLIGAYIGSAVNFVAVARNYSFVKYRQTFRRPVLPWTFICLFAVAVLASWQGYISLLPLGGMVFGTIAYWHKNPTVIRMLSLFCSPMWFAYNYISGSYPGMIIEVFVFSSILIAILRYDILKQPATKTVKRAL